MTDLTTSDAARVRRAGIASWTPFLVLFPSLVATLVYVLGFSLWIFWLSLSTSTLLPNPTFQGFEHDAALWEHSRWRIAYMNLFFFGSLYAAGSLLLGTVLAILIDQKARGESIWRSIYLYPLAISFVVTGTVWRWILNPTTGVETLLRDLGWAEASFDWIINRDMAIYTVVIVGIWHASGFAMALTPEDWDRAQSVNIRAQFFAAQGVRAGMKAAGGGAIVNLSSVAWEFGAPDMIPYITAKAAVIGLTNGLARAFGPDGIRVNAVSPGAVMTPKQMALGHTPESKARLVPMQALAGDVSEADVADAVVFLASDAARSITKQCLVVDGGLT